MIQEALGRLLDGHDLTREQARAAMGAIMASTSTVDSVTSKKTRISSPTRSRY